MRIYTNFRMVLIVSMALLLAACSATELAFSPTGETGGEPAVPAASPVAATSLPDEGAGAAQPTAHAGTRQAGRIPLEEALEDLQPREVFKHFDEITRIPRPSGQMDKIRAFLVAFGEGQGLETIVDEAGNVIIRRPASTGFEGRAGVVLQAHMDMVAQKNDEKVFDFATDPIEAYVDGDYVVADGTTLGADDGIGMAMILAVLQDEDLEAGPIEGLFTVDEETDMSGINGLAAGELQGATLINLDSEEEGTFTIGSAGGERATLQFRYPQEPAPVNTTGYRVVIKGLKGGHSGVDINLGRGHAAKILARLLKEATGPYGLHIASFSAGTAGNAIPREAEALVYVSGPQVEPFRQFSEAFEAKVRAELQWVEPDLRVEVAESDVPQQIMEERSQATLINALYGTPQGVLRMSDAVPGLVETSTNMGIANVMDGQAEVVNYLRSSVDSSLEDTAQMISSVWELAGQTVAISDAYSGWAPDPDSAILALMRNVYTGLYGQEPTVSAVHAGLECGVVAGPYPDMDMISIGPTLENVHSPSERLYIPSVARVMDMLTTTLEQMP